MKTDVQSYTFNLNAKEMLADYKMPRAGNGKKLGHTL